MSPFPLLAGIGAIPVLLLSQAGAETLTTVIRPSVAYTVKDLVNGVYQNKQQRLYANGHWNSTSSNLAQARMEFEIPLAVRVGLKTMEFRAAQQGFSSPNLGGIFLMYYSGNVGETTKVLSTSRDGFSANNAQEGAIFSSNLLDRIYNRAPIMPLEKFGLVIHTNLKTPAEMTFTDPQIVITYESPPPDNAGCVHNMLTTAHRQPFAGQTDPAVIGFDADPDRDGLPNFYELWRGSAPDISSSLTPPVIGKADGLPYIRVRVDKYADDRMLVGAQASRNLVDWRDISTTRTTEISGTVTYAKFTDVIAAAEGQPCYFRFVGLPEGRKYE